MRSLMTSITITVLAPAAFVLVGICAWPATGIGESSTSVVVGKCNSVNQNVRLGRGASLNVYIDCDPGNGKPGYRIRYLWLNSRQISFLLANYIDDTMAKLVSGTPKLVRNEVGEALENIMKIASVRLTTTGGGVNPAAYALDLISPDIKTASGQSSQPTAFPSGRTASSGRGNQITGLSDEVLGRLRIYTGEEPIIWFDAEASRMVKETLGWPAAYKISYGKGSYDYGYRTMLFGVPGFSPAQIGGLRPNSNADIGKLLTCVILHRFATQLEFKSYWDRVADAEKMLSGKLLDRSLLVNQRFLSDDGNGSLRDMSIKNEAMDAIDHFTEKNWPDDFLLVAGKYEESECGGGGGFGFYAIPRKLFVLFAVIEPLSKDVELGEIGYNVDAESGLRTGPAFSSSRNETMRPITLRRGESAVIPLRIELRYLRSEYPISAIADDKQSLRYYDAIQKSRAETFTLRYNEPEKTQTGELFFAKARASFEPPQPTAMRDAYVFGNALQIETLMLDGIRTKIVPPPASAVLAVLFAGEGSCPFMYFREPDGQLSLFGRVLVGASSQSEEREQVIRIRGTMKSLIVAEKEPEISFIKSIEARDKQSGATYRLAENIEIRPNRAAEFPLPTELSADSEIVIRGYYQSLFAVR
jgi:hypothetical protein